MTLPRFLVTSDALDAPRAVLTGAELRHLRVRRLRAGSAVILCDAQGRQRHGVVRCVERHGATVELTDNHVRAGARESPLRLTLAQALLKANKLDLVVEKATELGVTEVVVFASERSIGTASGERIDRWNRIARSSAKQCQRSTVPQVSGPVPFASLLCLPRDTAGLLFWEGHRETTSALAELSQQRRPAIVAVVGPEGGFSAREAAQASAGGLVHVGLGPRILRAETAAIAALTLCQFLWGDLAGSRS